MINVKGPWLISFTPTHEFRGRKNQAMLDHVACSTSFRSPAHLDVDSRLCLVI